MTAEIVREGVERSRRRLGVETIDLLQFHWWSFEHPAYLDAMKHLDALRREGLIRRLGVTNFDTAHLNLLVKHGIPIVANQVSFSLLDRRAAGEMSAFCLANGVRLLAYGTLAGGLMSERWLGRPEPGDGEIADWSKMKYRRFVEAAGGWDALQAILAALDGIAKKHRRRRSPMSRRAGRSITRRSRRSSSARGSARPTTAKAISRRSRSRSTPTTARRSTRRWRGRSPSPATAATNTASRRS